MLALALAALAASPYHPLNSTRCLDGSPAGLYWRAGASNSTDTIIYLEGGPDCADGERCAQVLRSGGGSNAGLPATLEEYFAGDWSSATILDPSPAVNPPLHGASVAYVPYCTADFHAGTRTAPVNGTFWFNGHHVVQAVVDFALARGAGAPDHRLILAGGSSGGMGTVRNVDAVLARLRARAAVGAEPPVVMGIVLGGFYFYQRPYTGPGAASVGMDFSAEGFRVAFAAHAAFVPPACRAAMPREPWLCSQANSSLPHVRAPLFFAEALTDRVVTTNHAGLPTLTREILSTPGPLSRYVATYTDWMRSALALRIAQNTSAFPHRGLFAPACYDHTMFATAGGPRARGRSFTSVLARWLELHQPAVPSSSQSPPPMVAPETAPAPKPSDTIVMDDCGSPLCGTPAAVPPLH